MTFCTECLSQKFGQFLYVPFRERGLRRLTFLKGEKSTLSNMVILYIIGMQILYSFENAKEPLPDNSYLRRTHGIIVCPGQKNKITGCSGK